MHFSTVISSAGIGVVGQFGKRRWPEGGGNLIHPQPLRYQYLPVNIRQTYIQISSLQVRPEYVRLRFKSKNLDNGSVLPALCHYPPIIRLHQGRWPNCVSGSSDLVDVDCIWPSTYLKRVSGTGHVTGLRAAVVVKNGVTTV